MKKRGNPNWAKDANGIGKSGNPGGEPKDSKVAEGTQKLKNFWPEACDILIARARAGDMEALKIISKKVAPDLQSVGVVDEKGEFVPYSLTVKIG